ncbi:MAG: trypsin-like peptidase domain-containing protein [Acidobacteria bacterium]|nr:trypsin-like peptidase domain-containing protein [Acidobacteriota bacterium]
MATNLVIHISVGSEKRTEFFSDDRISIGSSEHNDIQIHSKDVNVEGTWLELELTENVYRIINANSELRFVDPSGQTVRRYVAISDGDRISIDGTDIAFAFFAPATRSSLITTRRDSHVAQFIEEAALESAGSPKRDDAKVFLKEFVRELSREISFTSTLVALVLIIGFVSGIFYLGFAVNRELKKNREQSEQQSEFIRKLEERLGQTSDQIGEIDKSNKEIIKSVSLAPNLRVEYGNGVCLIVGVYELVSKANNKTLRYPQVQPVSPNPYEPAPSEDQVPIDRPVGLTTEGNGTPIEYDFIGTGFHVGGGFLLTNRHVLRPWEDDDLIKQMMRDGNGKPRIKKLLVYFPNYKQPFPLVERQIGGRQDLAVASIDPAKISTEIPVLPLDASPDAMTIGKTVVSMGYPSGPDRLLAMFDDTEARGINARCNGLRQCIINFLAQNLRIAPLLTQGAITDLDSRRIVHDAKTAEGGSGAPVFGQTGKVIGVNFGIFTENTAANMAVPISFAIDLLKKSGWKSPEELLAESQNQAATTPQANTNTKPAGN